MSNPLAKGYLLALLGVFILSPDALLIRLINDDPAVITAWRGIVGGIMVLLYNQWFDRRSLITQLRPAGLWAVAAIVLNALSQMSFVYAISHANVTDVLVIIASAPLASAFLSAIFLHEKILLRTWLATSVCVIGLAMLLLQPDGHSETLGLVIAFICALTMAAQFVVMRGFPKANFTGCIGLGNILSGVFCAFIAESLWLEAAQWPPVLIMALLVAPVSFMLFVISLRYISAAEVSLIMLLESILGSVWVWFVVSESPSLQTVLAGSLILLTLAVYTAFTLKDDKQQRQAFNT